MIPVGLSSDLLTGDIAPVRHRDDAVVLWRDEQGTLRAWEDRCPHRGVRLSLGFVRNGRLACQYHGWQFDTAGQCRVIPAHPALNPPSTIRTSAYDAVEEAGLIWIDFHSRGQRPLTPPAHGVWHGVRSLAIRAPEREIRAALMIETGQWRLSGDRLLALHMPQPDIGMVHLAIRDAQGRREAAEWLVRLRDSLEETAC